MAPACQVPPKAARSLLGAMLPAARGTSRGRRERQPGRESGVLGDPAPSPPAEVDGRPLPRGTPFVRESWTRSRFLAALGVGCGGGPPSP